MIIGEKEIVNLIICIHGIEGLSHRVIFFLLKKVVETLASES